MTKILICDDDSAALSEIAAAIDGYYKKSDKPYKLSKFAEPSAALAFVEDGNTVDIAILDIIMPKMNGMELAEKLRALDFSGYLTFLTSSNDFAAQSYSVNAFSYILKPVKADEVHDLLSSIEKTRSHSERNGFPLTRSACAVLRAYVCRSKRPLFIFLPHRRRGD
jgi:DNA-binding LytR/AlgR family response regulator